MVTLELPQARRLAMSVVLGQVVVTVVAAVICFAVWGRTRRRVRARGRRHLGRRQCRARAHRLRLARGCAGRTRRAIVLRGRGREAGGDGGAVRRGVPDDEGVVRRAVRRLHRHVVRVLDCARECAAAAGGNRERARSVRKKSRCQQPNTPPRHAHAGSEYIVHHLPNLQYGQGFWTFNVDSIFLSVLLGLVFVGFVLAWPRARPPPACPASSRTSSK